MGAVISAFSECKCNRLSQQQSERQVGKEVTLLLCWSEVLFFASLVKSTFSASSKLAIVHERTGECA